MTRKYRNEYRVGKKAGVPKNDPRWSKLFDFMKENDFTIEDFLGCVCANLSRYANRYYSAKIAVGSQVYKVDIEKWGFNLNEIN